MKKLIYLFVFVFFLASCKESNEQKHTEKHSSFVSFIVSNSANIESYNVYLNEQLVGQISSTGTDSVTRYSYMHDGITEHPDTLNYAVEPMYYDSANAKSDISLFLTVDEERVAETPTRVVRYNEIIRLSHTVD